MAPTSSTVRRRYRLLALLLALVFGVVLGVVGVLAGRAATRTPRLWGSFYGDWTRHVTSLRFDPVQRTGSQSVGNVGNVGETKAGQYIYMTESYAISLSRDGRVLTATITSIKFTAVDGAGKETLVPDPNPSGLTDVVGDVVAFHFAGPDLIYSESVHQRWFKPGTVQDFFCGDHITPQDERPCGA